MDTLRIRAVYRGVRAGLGQEPDGELLAAFAVRRCEVAFDELLRRHGPTVRAICRRVLGAGADADDAFQATFLIFVRKSRSIRQRTLLANWLCAVAYRAARQLRRERARRVSRERQNDDLPQPAVRDEPPRDWLPLFDAALQSLPPKYREAVVLCELHGVARAAAACRLGLSEGTLSSRLARARTLLGRRLGRWGFPLSAGAALAPALVPDALAAATSRHAMVFAARLTPLAELIPAPILMLTGAVMRESLSSKVRTGVILMIALLALSPLVLRGGAGGAEPPQNDLPPSARPPEKIAPSAGLRELQGTWRAVAVNGRTHIDASFYAPLVGIRERTAPFRERNYLTTFAGDQVRMQLPGAGGVTEVQAPFRIGAPVSPRTISIGSGSWERQGIFKLDAGRLTVLFSEPGMKRPVSFDAAVGDGTTLLVLERHDPKADEPHSLDPNEPVAVFNGDVKITRAEFGEFLIRSDGAEKLKRYVNLRILEHAASQKGVTVSDAEIDEAVRRDLKELGMDETKFTEQVLGQHVERMTLPVWRDQVVRPRLLAMKLCRTRVTVSDDEVRREYANRPELKRTSYEDAAPYLYVELMRFRVEQEMARFVAVLIAAAKPQLLLR
jgi:RNA polymerase sigma factor (sigma-70 family)